MQKLKQFVVKFPILVKMYLYIFPPKNKKAQKFIINVIKQKERIGLTDFKLVNSEFYFKSIYGAYFVYVPNWGAYQNEFGITHEKIELDYLIKELKPNSTIIDVGANYGVFCVNIANSRPDLNLYAFEPIKKTYLYLEKNVKSNDLAERININNYAVGAKQGSLKMISNLHTNNSVINNYDVTTEQNIEEVIVINLDSYIAGLPNINNISLIKIDVEGFEKSVIDGSLNVIKQYKPLLLLEIYDGHLIKFNSSAKEMIEFVLQLGYEIKEIEGFVSTNYLFIPKA